MILWLLGVEILAFIEADPCFFLGEMKPELKVRFLAELEKAVLFTDDEELRYLLALNRQVWETNFPSL